MLRGWGRSGARRDKKEGNIAVNCLQCRALYFIYICIYMYNVCVCIYIYIYNQVPRSRGTGDQTSPRVRAKASRNALAIHAVSRSAFPAVSAPFGRHRVTFGGPFCDFLSLSGVLLDCTHSQAKTYIFRFGRSQVGTRSSTFSGADSGGWFYAFLIDIV